MSIHIKPGQLASLSDVRETHQNLGKLIRLNRRALDLTQERLGERAGIKPSSICRFEQHGQATLDVFIRTARGLGLPSWALLKIAEDPDAYEVACSLQARHFVHP